MVTVTSPAGQFSVSSTSPRPSSGHAVDRSLPVDVRLPFLPSFGYLFRYATSPAMLLLSLTVVSHSGRLPRSWSRLFRCATSPAMSLVSLTVVSQPSSSPDSAAAPWRVALPSGMGPGDDGLNFWVFMVAFHRWIGPGGAEFDCWVYAGEAFVCWVYAGVPAVVLPVVLRRSLYVIYSTCLPSYNVVRPGASCHCECSVHAERACFLAFRRALPGLLGALPTQLAMRVSLPRSARCVAAWHAPTFFQMCKVS
jgi:hypothetical protein